MKVLTNKGPRRLGVPGRPALVLDMGKGTAISDRQLAEIQKNRTVARWLQSGILVVTESEDGPDAEPIKITPPVARVAPKGRSGVRVARGHDTREPLVLPEGIEGKGTELHYVGGGWYELYVNGFKVSDRSIRKDEAEAMAAEYEE